MPTRKTMLTTTISLLMLTKELPWQNGAQVLKGCLTFHTAQSMLTATMTTSTSRSRTTGTVMYTPISTAAATCVRITGREPAILHGRALRRLVRSIQSIP